MAMKFCTKFVCNSFSAYFFPLPDFIWFSLLKQGVTIARRFCYLCASTCIPIPLVPTESSPCTSPATAILNSFWSTTYGKGELCGWTYNYPADKKGADKVWLCPKKVSWNLRMNTWSVIYNYSSWWEAVSGESRGCHRNATKGAILRECTWVRYQTCRNPQWIKFSGLRGKQQVYQR